MSVKVIRELVDEEYNELAEGISSLARSDGFHSLLELLERVSQVAKEAAIDGKPEDLPLHRGWRDCSDYLRAQLMLLPQIAERVREERKEAAPEKVGDYVTLLGLASGDGNL